MALTTIIIAVEFAIVASLVVMLVVRQVRGQYMDRRRLWGVPIILAAVGVVYIPLTARSAVPADVPLALLGVLIAVGVGLGLGTLTEAVPAEHPDRRGRTLIIRSGWKGGLLWVGFIGIRLALQPLASALHAHLVTSAAGALILVAITRATMAVIVAPRLARMSTAVSRAADQGELDPSQPTSTGSEIAQRR